MGLRLQNRRLELSFSHKNNKITTKCWTTFNQIHWRLSKQISYSRRQRGGHVKVAGGVVTWYKQPHPYPPGGQPTDWRVTMTDSPTGVRVLSPTSGPNAWGPGTGRKSPPERLASMASGACAQEIQGTEGSGDPIFERSTQTFMYTGSQGKAETP